MGKNTGDGHRNGQMKDRKQFYNPKTGQYYKINTETGKIMSAKDTPYKGVRQHNKSSPKKSK
jgi:hypothetical protein